MDENNQIEQLKKRIEELEKKLAGQKENFNKEENIKNIESNLAKQKPTKSNKKDYDDDYDDDDDLKSTHSETGRGFSPLFYIGIALIFVAFAFICNGWINDTCDSLSRAPYYIPEYTCRDRMWMITLFAIPLGLILSIAGIVKRK